MNVKMIVRMLGNILLLEAAFMLPPLGIAICDGDIHVARAIVITIALLLFVTFAAKLAFRKVSKTFYAREGFLLVAMSWILVSLAGSLIFYLSGEIPRYIDALFESVSGVTTTGATILAEVEKMSRAGLYWRSFSQWLGGMGILVFMLAVVPSDKGSGQSMYVLKAEVPGPSVDKIVPKTRHNAALLYGIYVGMTLLCLVMLLAGGMPVFDSICVTFSTAGTGGFAVYTASAAAYSAYSQIVITVFMALFATNMNLYYLLIMRRFRDAFKDEEFRVYLGIMFASIIAISLNIYQQYKTVGEAVRHAAFTVSSIMSTSGFATENYDLWPQLSRVILLVLMVLGACAGSTGGGIKISRLLLLFKMGRCEMRRILHPRSVMLVKYNGRVVGENVFRSMHTYFLAYTGLLIATTLIISFDNFPFETNFSAAIACLNNIGPGLGLIGPIGNFSHYSTLSKLVLSANMLFGRLEIFPFLLLLHPRSWNRAA